MAKASGSANGFDISNCVFRDNNSAGACIRSKANGWWKIRDCVFTNNVRTATTSTIYGGVVDVELTSAPLNDSAFGQIKNCTFKDNTVDVNRYYGAVVSARLGGVNMDSCSFVSNTVSRTGTSSSKGGALYMGGNGAKVSNCTFVGETPDNAGYDMYGTVASAYDGNCVFSNCTFSAIEEKSSAKSKYGTVHVGGDGVKFVDCRFTGNTLYATSLLFLENKGDMLVRNCLFAKNERKNKNGRLLYRHGTAVTSSTAMTVENCTFADNTDTIAPCYFANADYTSYFINSVFTTESMLSGVTTSSLLVSNCCVTAFQEIGGLTYNDKCITKAAGECGFVDPEHGDYHLEMRSPLREKGVKLDWMTADATDLDGNPRVVSRFAEPLSKCASAMPDIGCYECMIRVPAFIVIVR